MRPDMRVGIIIRVIGLRIVVRLDIRMIVMMLGLIPSLFTQIWVTTIWIILLLTRIIIGTKSTIRKISRVHHTMPLLFSWTHPPHITFVDVDYFI